MKESYLYLIWEQFILKKKLLKTTQGDSLVILQKGYRNKLQGPDFTEVLLEINHQKWAGNVEFHVKSSDWYAHKHHLDKAYQNIILHVVYEHDVEVFDAHQNIIPTLELKSSISSQLHCNYDALYNTVYNFIPCEVQLKEQESLIVQNWLERLYTERLERKTQEILLLYKQLKNSWEATMFVMLMKSFGGNLNGELFKSAIQQIDFSIVKKCLVNKQLTSLIFGVLGLLEQEIADEYYVKLKKEYDYLKHKYQLRVCNIPKLHFYGCRPSNFPTIKLIQLIGLYEKHVNLFGEVLDNGFRYLQTNSEFWKIDYEDYWKTHFTFGKISNSTSKQISKETIKLVQINVLIPLFFVYYRCHQKNEEFDSVAWALQLQPEKNHIVKGFQQYGLKVSSALASQALITLKQHYCDLKQCDSCAIGLKLLIS